MLTLDLLAAVVEFQAENGGPINGTDDQAVAEMVQALGRWPQQDTPPIVLLNAKNIGAADDRLPTAIRKMAWRLRSQGRIFAICGASHALKDKIYDFDSVFYRALPQFVSADAAFAALTKQPAPARL